jgi:chromodomain-helicase-DNA-binding protein 4
MIPFLNRFFQDEDDDYEPEDGRKKKKGKKRKARGEEKKGKKKKKKRKNDSGDVSVKSTLANKLINNILIQESDFLVDDDNGAGDSDYATSKKGRKSRSSTKHPSTPSTPAESSSTTGGGMPTIEEVCSTFGLTDVELEYTESDFQNLTTYKLFQQHVRPLLTKENPKVCCWFCHN